jgi:hypothetical protein
MRARIRKVQARETNLSKLDCCHDVKKILIFARFPRTGTQTGIGIPIIGVGI